MAVEKFTTVGRGPQPRSQHSAAVFGSYFVVFGGRSNNIFSESMKNVAFNDLHLLNISSREWVSLALFGEELPESRWGHSMVATNSSILLFGGMNLKHYCPSAVYEFSSNQKKLKRYLKQKTLRTTNLVKKEES